MLDKLGKVILIIVLTICVILGGYLGYYRYFIELQDRTVELCVDLNDLKKIAAYDDKPLGPIMDELGKIGVVSIGVFEQTLPDAAVDGQIYYAKGSGVRRLNARPKDFNKFVEMCHIKGKKTYIYAPEDDIRKRIYKQLKIAVGERNLKFLSKDIIEINEAEEELRCLGLGLPESQVKFVMSKGFRVIPRVWNDPRYHLGSVNLKIKDLKDYDTIIFEGEEILGYPESLNALASAMQENKLRYGFIEIVKQDGDKKLRRLMGKEVVRVHSVPKEELKKLYKDEVIRRFVRAARERKVRLIYMRPFLPPQIDAYTVPYNLKFFGQVKTALEKAGYVIGRAEPAPEIKIANWTLLALGIGVMIGVVFLLGYFIRLNSLIMFLLVAIATACMYILNAYGYSGQLQKLLAWLTAVTFPSLAVISSLSRKARPGFIPLDGTLIVLNIVAEAFIGVFLLIGLLADQNFMLGVETFKGVKLALVLPLMIVAFYFILKQGEGGLIDRIKQFLNTNVKMVSIVGGIMVLGGLGLYLARSGNFVLPVPVFEVYFRNFLEAMFFIRPRTKEFIIGYPFLYLAAIALLRNKKGWLWILAALGAIAPVSILNTFAHIHTPLVISVIRTINGLVLGVAIGAILSFIVDFFIKKEA